jgi:hypothetical protein
MSILDRAKAHFETQEVKRIEVPEWGDESGNPAIIMSEPFTLADRKSLIKFAQDDDMEFLVRLIIMKALDESGNKIFDLSDKPTLMNKVDPNVLLKIANQITEVPSIEEMKGN